MLVIKKEYTRSSNYRMVFFEENKPAFRNKYYQCAYCGRLLTKDTVTIDHLLPIQKVKRNKDRNVYKYIEILLLRVIPVTRKRDQKEDGG